MPTIMCVKSVPVKPLRRTPRLSAPFGAGIESRSYYHPFAGQMPYTQADLDEAAAMFADARVDAITPDWDAMAQEAEYQARLDAMAPATYGRCVVCSAVADYLEPNGLCPNCDVHACETSSVNGVR
jgi:hypothetical protein